jgi:hypothetical protein
LDEKINKGRYVYVVKRSQFYKELTETISETSLKQEQTLKEGRKLADEVLKVKSVSKVKPGLEGIANDNITIDQLLDQKCRLSYCEPEYEESKQCVSTTPAPKFYKRQSTNLMRLMRTNEWIQIPKVAIPPLSKIVQTPDETVYILGGLQQTDP